MTVTDEAKLFAIRQQLMEMRYKLDASINIINYVFERVDGELEVHAEPTLSVPTHTSDTVKLHPGQIAPPPDYTDVDPEDEFNLINEEHECEE